MKMTAAIVALVASLALTACGPNETPKAMPTAAQTSTAAPIAKGESKKEEKMHVPDTHGMPGMSELFKGGDKAGEKRLRSLTRNRRKRRTKRNSP